MSKKNDDFFEKKKVWSEIKDQLLGCYLVPYFSKISMTKKPVYYIDAFAGKGKFDDGSPGSPIIALDIISKFPNSKICSAFIELNYANDLMENIKRYPNTKIVEGRYEDYIENLLVSRAEQNIFVYIDPYGIKSLKFSIFEKWKNHKFNSIEILLNFNSFGFIREACNALNVRFNLSDLDDVLINAEQFDGSERKSINELSEVAGGDYWKDIIEDYKAGIFDGYEAERKFITQYCLNLRRVFRYVLNMPIRLKKGQRPKYRMIYATNHQDGCILMNDNMCKRWEALEEIQNYGQLSLFEQDAENNVIDESELLKLLEREIKQITNYVHFNIFLADFIMKVGVRYSQGEVTKQLSELERTGKIEVRRYPMYTDTGRSSKFWSEKKGKTVEFKYRK